jgi:hypothetical protein
MYNRLKRERRHAMAEHNYGELFCEAVDTIIKERLQSIPYDSTILCTIVDDSQRE